MPRRQILVRPLPRRFDSFRTKPMCGIIGIVGRSEVAAALYDGLTVLQHRGQDAAGIATFDGQRLHLSKGNGLVRDVFDTESMARLRGNVGIGHCRYPTAGSEGAAEAQPFYVNSPFGIALAHNGNLTNTRALKREVYAEDRRHINTDSDSEVLLNIFAHELQAQERLRLEPEHLFTAVAGVHSRCVGGYAVVALVLGLVGMSLCDQLIKAGKETQLGQFLAGWVERFSAKKGG